MNRPFAFVLMAATLLAAPVVADSAKGCPPGLAKKAVACVPPGQAAKWQVGARLPMSTPWYEVRDWKRLDLREPQDGSRYVRVDNEILRVAVATGIVLESLGLFN